MHASTTLATLSLIAPFVAAHGHGHQMPIPRVFGSRNLAQRAAGPLPAPKPKTQPLVKRAEVLPRAADPDTCGAGVGSCAANKCCSSAGYCGIGKDYCAAPDCQINYGPACDANNAPPGSDTSTVARPKLGSVLYGGGGIYQCTVPGTVAITYDDGPYIYTKTVLDLFDKYNAKATFFITANNLGKGPIDDPSYPWYDLIKRMDASGHQIASHTWSHQDLSAITAAQRTEQIYLLEGATRNILGKFPTYMRPPYSSCNADCQTFLGTAGYHIVYFDQDTSDYLFATPGQIQISKDYVTTNLTKKGNPKTDDWLVIAHDIQDQTSNNLTEFMLKSYTEKGFKLVTVGDCLADPVSNWYRTASGAGTYSAKSSPVASATASAVASKVSSAVVGTATGVSKDATCGSKNSLSCLGTEWGNCCSAAGWCGATDVYCGTGCQLGFGNCGSNSGSAASSATTSGAKSGSAAASGAASASAAGSGSVAASAAASGSVAASAAASGSAAVSAKSAASGTGPAASVVSSASGALPSLGLSQDSTCGPVAKLTCLGFAQGECCSQYGYCGSTDGHCGDGCQKGYGKCTGDVFAASSIVSRPLSLASAAGGASSAAGGASSAAGAVSSAAAAASSAAGKASSSEAVKASSSAAGKASSSLPAALSSLTAASPSASAQPSAAKSSSVASSAKSPFSTIPSARPSASPTPLVSGDKKCGSVVNQTCTGSIFGTCCIQFSSVTPGTCYSGSICTLLKNYCQDKFGKC